MNAAIVNAGAGLVNIEADREELQGLFLWLVADETPEVVEDLAETGRDDLRAWATRWRINSGWVLDHASHVLRDLVRWPKAEPLELWRSTGGGPGWVPAPIEFRAVWDPCLPSENLDHRRVTGRRAEARARLHELLERYLDGVETAAAEAGFEPMARRDGGGNVPTADRVRWLVWHTVRGESWRTIADRAGIPRSTVSRLAKEMAEALPLWLYR